MSLIQLHDFCPFPLYLYASALWQGSILFLIGRIAGLVLGLELGLTVGVLVGTSVNTPGMLRHLLHVFVSVHEFLKFTFAIVVGSGFLLVRGERGGETAVVSHELVQRLKARHHRVPPHRVETPVQIRGGEQVLLPLPTATAPFLLRRERGGGGSSLRVFLQERRSLSWSSSLFFPSLWLGGWDITFLYVSYATDRSVVLSRNQRRLR